MKDQRMVIDIRETQPDDSGYLDLHRGVPFTGLVVELSTSDEVVSLTELVDGRAHGYAIDYHSGRPTSVDEYDHGTPHGLRATWEGARLAGASRYQYGIEDQRLRRDGTTEDLPEAAAKITRIHAMRHTHELLTASVRDLLTRFEQECYALLAEARRGLGLV